MASEIRWPLLILVLIFFTGLIDLLEAYQFNVGGREGWVLNPSENYNRWAERMRFQVNDTLFFKYMKGSDSVLVASKEDYDKCNTQKPILKMDGGDSVFKLDRSGPFYFITGNKTNCQNGQKLIIVVLAVRNKPTSPTPSPTLSPAPAIPTLPSPYPSTLSPPVPAGGAPAHINAPPPRSCVAPFTPSVVFVLLVTLPVLSFLGVLP
ncbi:Early nodulin-like protein [Actinidia chinensis var. chinensis]|uniref:Early nodulin-like protein n=1 Tax=Actinidia chinensis var. chinensis TaxID=1590841 RepID=A0A2R6QWP6_ACTCC|nr:Early nodulin-like protein [Actinidia chinensis var. chinensis]